MTLRPVATSTFTRILWFCPTAHTLQATIRFPFLWMCSIFFSFRGHAPLPNPTPLGITNSAGWQLCWLGVKNQLSIYLHCTVPCLCPSLSSPVLSVLYFATGTSPTPKKPNLSQISVLCTHCWNVRGKNKQSEKFENLMKTFVVVGLCVCVNWTVSLLVRNTFLSHWTFQDLFRLTPVPPLSAVVKCTVRSREVIVRRVVGPNNHRAGFELALVYKTCLKVCRETTSLKTVVRFWVDTW